MKEKPCIRMYCESEGRCHGIVFVFFENNQKELILRKADELSKRHRVKPDISVREKENYGDVFIEFYDSYHHEDACFFEDLVEALGAKLCNCEEEI